MQAVKGIMAGAIGSAVFLLFLLPLDVSFLLSLLAGVIIFIAVMLMWPKREAPPAPGDPDFVPMEFYMEMIKEGKAHADAIKSSIVKVPNSVVQQQLRSICDSADRIFDILAEKPQNVKVIRQFFSYYLETTSKIVDKYVELKTQNLQDPNLNEIMAKTEANIGMIAQLFEKKLVQLVSDDALDLDVELDLLEQMLRTEGLK